jgi:hypothetical protein
MPLPLYPRYRLDNRLGGPRSRSGRCEKKILCFCQELNSGRRAPSPSLYQMSYPGSYSTHEAISNLISIGIVPQVEGYIRLNGPDLVTRFTGTQQRRDPHPIGPPTTRMGGGGHGSPFSLPANKIEG